MTASEDPRDGSEIKKEVFAGQFLKLYKKYVDIKRSENVELLYTDKKG